MGLADLPKISHSNSKQFILIAGPCAIEGEEMAMRIAEKIKTISDKLSIPYIFKGSFKKANRSRLDSFTGIGDEKALKIIEKVAKEFDLPTITDIHQVEDAALASNYVDVLQIPAFLVRQTDLLVAAAKTNKFINLKKGQFMSPESMEFAVDKINSTGNKNTWITERGTQFGYQDLIVDYRGIPVMKNFAPTILDVTHSLQQPGMLEKSTGGRGQYVFDLAKAGVSQNIAGLFIETHPDPASAMCDGPCALNLSELDNFMHKILLLDDLVKSK